MFILHIRFNELIDKHNNSASNTATETPNEEQYSVVERAGTHKEEQSPDYSVVDRSGTRNKEEPDYSVVARAGPSAGDISEQLTDSIIVTSESVAYNIITDNDETVESVIYDVPFGYTNTTT